MEEDVDPPEEEVQENFVPDYTCADGHVISVTDSIVDSPRLAVTLLKGLALPRDMD